MADPHSKRLSIRGLLLGGSFLVAAPLIAQEGSGFLISVNGENIAGDPQIEPQISRPDEQLAEAELRIQYDGLTAEPVLDLEVIGPVGGPSVTVQSALNYPAFVTRGEVRVYDASGPGAMRLVTVVPISPNGRASVPITGADLYAVHRVYDARGRYDETAPLSLTRTDSRARIDGVEEGADSSASRGIPVYGGGVTVSGENVAPRASVTAMGESITPSPSGEFVIQRILPAGMHAVDVRVSGAGEPVDLVRDIDVPQADWFYVAVADLTFGVDQSVREGRTSYTDGRLAGYVNGQFANGVHLTAQLDTGEGPIDQIFSDLDKRDPLSVIDRIDPNNLYPTYGDDSTIVDDTPTSGRFYLLLERDNNFLLWGDYKAQVAGGYLRNERSLYGLNAHWESPSTTSAGEPQTSVDIYAAQPDRIQQRDVLTGTGGSLYFLNRQDIGVGSETITVQVRDSDTGRVLETRTLVAGQDYTINYVQGIVALSSPLSGFGGSSGVVSSETGRDADVALVVNYEYSPTSSDVDTFALGGRAQHWVSDNVRVGVTALRDETVAGDQTAIGADIEWRHSANTYAKLDYAVSDGPGYATTVSTDGGLVFDNDTRSAGSGEAIRLEGHANFEEIGLNTPGHIAGYFERRTAGFNTLDYSVANDEQLWGVSTGFQIAGRANANLYYDDYSDSVGQYDRTGGADLNVDLNDQIALAAGIETVSRQTARDTGQRTDAALRLTYIPADNATLYAYAQSTVSVSGTLGRNDRVGVGGEYGFANGWSVEGEVFSTATEPGARILVRQERGDYDSTYFGYELDPDREFDAAILSGTDKGRFLFGGTRDFGNGVTGFGENSYDLFGQRQTLTSAYGITYEASDYLTLGGAYEMSQVRDDINGDFDRQALSFVLGYQDVSLSASARLEYRRDDGTLAGTPRLSETALISSDIRYEIDEEKRLIANLDATRTLGDQVIVQGGNLTDFKLGYAYRPVDNERLNTLFRYRYLEDTYGQQLAGDNTPGSLQRSHVLSAELSFDWNRDWTLGAKIGARVSETAPDAMSAWSSNNAALAVMNMRYHFVNEWDALFEVRAMHLEEGNTTEYGGLGAVYRQVSPNLSVGVGYNFGTVSSDLTDIDYDQHGAFVNLVAQF